MGSNAIITAIDKELARLHEVRSLLVQKGKNIESDHKPGSENGTRRRLSAAARARIAAAQRRRWAAARKQARS